MRVRVCFLGGGGWVLRLGGLGLGCWGEGVAVASCALGRRLEFGAWGAFFFSEPVFCGRFEDGGRFGGCHRFPGFRSTKHALLSSIHPLRQQPEHLSRQKKAEGFSNRI